MSEEKSTLNKWLTRKEESSSKIPNKLPEQPSILSFGQERIWLLEQIYPNNNLYNYGHVYDILGPLDIDILVESFQQLIDKHEILRSTYHKEGEYVLQKVTKSHHIPVTYTDEIDIHCDRIQKFIHQPFDLTLDLPIRLCINREEEKKTQVILIIHHIAGDAWSMNIINRELSDNYFNLSQGQTKTEGLAIQYRDYAFWQRNQPIKESDINYWKQALHNYDSEIKLPMSRNSRSSFKGRWHKMKVPYELSQKVIQSGKILGVTPYVYWLTTFILFLSKYSNQTKLSVGSPSSNRDKTELENLIGFFNETLVFNASLEGDPSFAKVTKNVNETVHKGLAHKDLPFDTLVRELKPGRQQGENPLFQMMFLYNSMPEYLILPGISIKEEALDLEVSKFDLTLFVNEGKEGLELVFEHSERLEKEVIESIAENYLVLLKNVANNPNAKISDLSIVTKEQRKKIIEEWNDTHISIPSMNVLDLIEDHERLNHDKFAVKYNEQTLTYGQLAIWSNNIAAKLTSNHVKPEDFVGIYTHRSVEMIVAILGVLKAGAAYLPLDPRYPEERLNFMLSETKTGVVLVHPELSTGDLKGIKKKIVIESTTFGTYKKQSIEPSLAYIIYTSGSSGRPKGVPVTHENLICSTIARNTFYNESPKTFLLLSSFAFDSSIVGIFWALSSGGTLVLPPDRIEQDISQLTRFIQKYAVTHTLMLPSLYQVLLNHSNIGRLQSLTTLIVAGEAVKPRLRDDHFSLLPQTKLYNEYGPTEATVWCVAHEIKKQEKNEVPIGRPIPNSQAYVLDRHLNPVPPLVEGKLFIGGKNITGGYWNNQTLTEQRFSKNPFHEGNMYDTGDLARWRVDGKLEFLGRQDSQTKVRGHRIELEEIKLVLQRNDYVEMAEVIIDKTRNNQILGYVQSNKVLEESDLINALRKVLPEYMIPSRILILEALPRLPNGKVDLSRLPIPKEMNFDNYEAPGTAMENLLSDIWKEVLGCETIGIHDNFFDLGGDSIGSIQITAKVQKAEIKIEPTAIFKHQTIAELATELSETTSSNEGWSAIVPLKVEGEAPPLFCLHSGGAHVMFYQGFARTFGKGHPVYAIQPKGLEGQNEYHQSIAEMAADYITEIKKVQQTGPYHLLGTCFSNAVALDMVHQLNAMGEEVAVLYIVDSAPAYLKPPSPNGERMPVRRLLKLIAEGKWNDIYKKIRNRYIIANRKFNAAKTSEVQNDLYDMIDSLNELYSKYEWHPAKTLVVLIRSSEFATRKGKQFHLDNWRYLSGDNLEVYEVLGHHKTLFQKPEVDGLAKQIWRHKSTLNQAISQ